jgi:hypothetical protein
MLGQQSHVLNGCMRHAFGVSFDLLWEHFDRNVARGATSSTLLVRTGVSAV